MPATPHAQPPPGPDPADTVARGPLHGVRVIEFAGLGPCPMAGMMLADMGADVIVIDRAQPAGTPTADGRDASTPAAIHRHKRSIVLNLKQPDDVETAWRLLESADALIEGFRPGVMERLGFSPEAVARRCPKLVFGRVTGWGQTGPLAQAAGHDINYVALTGVLSTTLRAQPPQTAPTLPATIVGDMGGGAMYLAFGVVCALFESQRSGQGQVVDAAMVDGVASLAALVQQMRATRYWRDETAHNFFLGSSPFYDAFVCADGKHVTLGAIEPAFYGEMLGRLGLDDVDPAQQFDDAAWPALRQRVANVMATRTQAEWCQRLEGTDACFAPVLTFDESARHPHMAARGTWVSVGDGVQPAAAPRFSRTPGRAPAAGITVGQHTEALRAACHRVDAAPTEAIGKPTGNSHP